MRSLYIKVCTNKYLHAVFVAITVLAIMTLFSIICGITPFGNSTWIVYDMRRQYVDFYSYYQGILSGDNNIFYSPSISLGSGAVGLFTYYLSSPFMLIFAFVDKASIPSAISIMIMLKLAFAGGCFDLFLNHYLKDNSNKTFIFSISYSLCAYMISNSINPMWLDVYILTPIVIWMLDRLLYHNSKTGYILSLAYMIYCNYYIAYMVCLFIVMWTLYRIFTDRMPVIRKLMLVALCSILAVLLDSVFILPTLLELAGGPKDIASLGLHAVHKYPGIRELLSKLWFLAYDYQQALFGTPLIYIGTGILTLTVLYFANKGIPIKEKIGMACMMVIIVLSFISSTLSLVWHGGMEPSGYPHREAFLLVFLCIICACKGFNNFSTGVSWRSIIITIVIICALLGISLTGGYFYANKRMIISNIILVVLVATLICLYYVGVKNFSTKIYNLLGSLSLLAFIVLQTGELLVNSVFTYKTLAINASINKVEFAQIVSTNDNLVKLISKDNDFFRMENMQPREQNDSMMYHFNGITHYSSSDLIKPRLFLSRLGYNNTSLFASYGKDNTCTADSILGIRYLMNTNGLRANYNTISDKAGDLVENPYQLSIAMAVTHKSTDYPSTDPFSLQEKIYKDITDSSVSIFEDVIIDSFKSDGDQLSQTFICNPQSNGYVYFYLNGISDKAQNLIIYLNGDQFSFYGNQSYMRILNLGYYNAGDTFEVEVRCEDLDADFGQALIKTENIDKLSAAYDIAQNRNLNISQITPSRYDIQLPEDGSSISYSGIATTIPFSPDWKVSLDGKKMDIEEIYDTFLYIPVSENMYGKTITMTYIPKGMSIGLALTIISIICLIIINRATLSMILNHMILNISIFRKESE